MSPRNARTCREQCPKTPPTWAMRGQSVLKTVPPSLLGLFEAPTSLATSLADELQAHLDRGRSPAEGVRLVAILVRAGARALAVFKLRKETTRRGSRLPADWQPSRSERRSRSIAACPQARLNTEAEKFRNCWTAKSGAGATKRDWSATSGNWIITAMERGNGPLSNRGQGPGTSNPPRRAPTGSDAILAGMVASRVASMNDEPQRSTTDGKYRTLPTLPANLVLNEAERAEIERHAGELDALCAQTLADSNEWEAATLIIITKLMLALPAVQQNEASAEATGEAFQAALADVPSWPWPQRWGVGMAVTAWQIPQDVALEFREHRKHRR